MIGMKCKYFDEETGACHCEEIWKRIGKPAGFGCIVMPYWEVCKFYEVET